MSPFEVLPALDVAGGTVASMRAGDPSTLRRLGGDPVAAAERLVEAGARWIHLVDLDAAVTGRAANLELLRAVCRLPVRVEAGGGLSPEGVADALAAGAARAILGAASLADPGAVAAAVARHGERLAVGLDVRGGVPDGAVAPRGAGPGGPPVARMLDRLRALRPALVVYTAVERDGAMAGPDLGGLAALAGALGVPVLASGGVRSLEDLRALAGVAGVSGAIVGRALHEGAFTLPEAMAAVGG